ncbi:MAG: polyhydroxyalkanoate synthesis regulator [Firmicutes bacterium]|nr:polyhydroxyalkanoate synthesis regulator [Bacillota bacterium]
MIDLLRKTLYMGLGALYMTKEKAEQLVEDLVKKGEVSTDEAKTLISELIQKGEQQKEELAQFIRGEMEKRRFDLGLVTKKDLERLEQRIKELEERLNPPVT